MKNNEYKVLTFQEELDFLLKLAKDGSINPIEWTCVTSEKLNGQKVEQTVSFKFVRNIK